VSGTRRKGPGGGQKGVRGGKEKNDALSGASFGLNQKRRKKKVGKGEDGDFGEGRKGTLSLQLFWDVNGKRGLEVKTCKGGVEIGRESQVRILGVHWRMVPSGAGERNLELWGLEKEEMESKAAREGEKMTR